MSPLLLMSPVALALPITTELAAPLCDPAKLTVNGSAVLSPCQASLTPLSGEQASSLFLTAPFSVDASTTFSSHFEVHLAHSGPIGGAGMTFVVQSSPEGATALGGSGPSLGLEGIAPSLAVELDTHQQAWDGSDNGVAVVVDGDVRGAVAEAEAPFELNEPPGLVDVWVEGDLGAGELRVWVGQAGVRPEEPLVVGVGGPFPPGPAWFGFTASTGSLDLDDTHDLRSWSLSLVRADGDADGVADAEDRCPGTPDPDQGDADGDGVGDACDPCPLAADDVDSDGDGVCDRSDCEPLDPTTWPGAPERCDGLANDCGTLPLDERDLDGDGVLACEGDCDDEDASVGPGAEELCGGVDEDCDGVVADDELDLDDDGVAACEGDCDDEDASIRPGAAEACDGVDQDCDGEVDESCPPTLLDDQGGCRCDGIANGAPSLAWAVVALLAWRRRRP